MKVSDFSYDLPEELIAQTPLAKRDESRLLVLGKESGEITHRHFYDILDYLNPGDCLVLNNTRVLPARLYGAREDTGGAIEFLLLERKDTDLWETILKPGKRGKEGARIVFGNGELVGEITKVLDNGNRLIRFYFDGIFEEVLDRLGEMPLPPYIHEKLEDKERYQTVYAKEEGSAAAPTAGLHFTPELLDKVREKGVETAFLTLHVGLGTFRPVKAETVENHHMHSEYYTVSQETADTVNRVKENGGRIISVGTTSIRTLESACVDGKLTAQSGYTNIFIYPPYRFQLVDALITNFHLPESTLLMLVSALAGRENIMKAYEEAVKERYRFFSFGDAMFIC